MVAGGYDGSYLDVVEKFNLDTLTSCIVDVKLDVPRSDHTGDGDLVCGGEDDNDGDNLIRERSSHTSWSSGQQILLLGGCCGYTETTEIIMGDSTQAGFDLKYWDTR